MKQRSRVSKLVGIILVLLITFVVGYVSHDTIAIYIQQNRIGFSETINSLTQNYPEYHYVDYVTWKDGQEVYATLNRGSRVLVEITQVNLVNFKKHLENDYYESAKVFYDRSDRVIWYVVMYDNTDSIRSRWEEGVTTIKMYVLKIKKW